MWCETRATWTAQNPYGSRSLKNPVGSMGRGLKNNTSPDKGLGEPGFLSQWAQVAPPPFFQIMISFSLLDRQEACCCGEPASTEAQTEHSWGMLEFFRQGQGHWERDLETKVYIEGGAWKLRHSQFVRQRVFLSLWAQSLWSLCQTSLIWLLFPLQLLWLMRTLRQTTGLHRVGPKRP